MHTHFVGFVMSQLQYLDSLVLVNSVDPRAVGSGSTLFAILSGSFRGILSILGRLQMSDFFLIFTISILHGFTKNCLTGRILAAFRDKFELNFHKSKKIHMNCNTSRFRECKWLIYERNSFHSTYLYCMFQ